MYVPAGSRVNNPVGRFGSAIETMVNRPSREPSPASAPATPSATRAPCEMPTTVIAPAVCLTRAAVLSIPTRTDWPMVGRSKVNGHTDAG